MADHIDQLLQVLLARQNQQPVSGPIDNRPLFSRPLQTDRTMLTRDDREDKRQTRGGIYAVPPNSTPSITGFRHTLDATPIAYAPMNKDEATMRAIVAALGDPQPKGIMLPPLRTK